LKTEDKGSQSSYDKNAREWAERMRSGKNAAHKYLEKPAMYAKLPDLNGKKVLCLGCGSGEEAQALAEKGADVVGVDLSKGLIEVAKQSYPDLEFQVMDMEELKFTEDTFDFVYSSLVMHYVPDWSKTLAAVKSVMKPGATFLFSTHHPVRWGADVDRSNGSRVTMGYHRQDKEQAEVYGDYLNRRQIEDIWFGNMPVTFFHKPFGEIMREIISSGLVISDFIEPKAIEEAKDSQLAFWKIHQKIPAFMIFELRKD
jgi:SAM-dependent methyltransferase